MGELKVFDEFKRGRREEAIRKMGIKPHESKTKTKSTTVLKTNKHRHQKEPSQHT